MLLRNWQYLRSASSVAGMASRFSELVIDGLDPQRLAEFWCEVFGFVVLDTLTGGLLR